MTDETQAVLDRVRDYLDNPPLPDDALILGQWSLNEDGSETSREVSCGDLRTLLATVEALREDARRMDWLERSGLFDGVPDDALYAVPTLDGMGNLGEGDTLRAAIDAACTPTPEGR